MNFFLDLHDNGSENSICLETVNYFPFMNDSLDTDPADTVPKDSIPKDSVPMDTVQMNTVSYEHVSLIDSLDIFSVKPVSKHSVSMNTVSVKTVPVAFIPLRGNPLEEDRCPELHEITKEHYGLPGLREANIVLKNLYAGATSDRSHKDIHGVPITKRSFEKIGITRFISLQEKHEEHDPLYGNVDHYGYPVDRCPVKDMSVTGDNEMLACAQDVFNYMAQGEVIYIHCQAGLGRTGVIVCIVLAIKYGIDSDHALLLCQKMKDCRCFKTPHKSPQTKAQVDQVHRIITRINSQ
jgi:hypothetical protein